MNTSILTQLFYTVLIGLSTIQLQAQHAERTNEILVQLNKDVHINEFMHSYQLPRSQSAASLQLIKPVFEDFNIYLLSFDESAVDRYAMLDQLARHPDIAAAELNQKASMRATLPNDPLFTDQWNMRQIDAPEAWDITTGGLSANGDTIIVAVLDSGSDVEHEDLAGNIWYNHAEIPNDNIDNDGNGYIDDYAGLYVKNGTDQHPKHFHGCAVTGIIGAIGNNNKGVAGVNWNVKMMLISGAEYEDEIVEAYGYAYKMRKLYNDTKGEKGAFVVAANYSFGINLGDCITEFPIWGSMYDSIGRVGILGVTATANENFDVDKVGDMPTTCPSNYMIAVTNSDENDDKVMRAGFGEVSIDLTAPGMDITTTKTNDEYGNQGKGTSWSAPLVSGTIALMYSLACPGLANMALTQPAETALLIKKSILDGVDKSPSLEGKVLTGGRLNTFNSLVLLQSEFGSQIGKLDVLKIFPNPPTDGAVYVEYQRPDFEAYDVKVYNSLGQLMFYDRIDENCAPKNHRISTFGYGAGVYFVTIENARNIVTGRFMVEK